MCLVSTSRKLRWKERTSGRRDFKPFFSLLPLGTRAELLGRSFPEGLTNEILFRTKNLTNFTEKNAYFKKSEKTILTENQCYMKIVPYCRKIFHEVSLPVGWIWPKSSTSCQSLLVWARVSQFTLFFAYFIRTHQFLSALILLNSGRNFTKCVIKCTVSVFSKNPVQSLCKIPWLHNSIEMFHRLFLGVL